MTKHEIEVYIYFTDETNTLAHFTIDELKEMKERMDTYGLYMINYGTLKQVQAILSTNKSLHRPDLMTLDEYLSKYGKDVADKSVKKNTVRATNKRQTSPEAR